jgi:hypothetical protein
MKKLLAIICALALAASLAACSGGKQETQTTTETVSVSETTAQSTTEESTTETTTKKEKKKKKSKKKSKKETTTEATTEKETTTEEATTEKETKAAKIVNLGSLTATIKGMTFKPGAMMSSNMKKAANGKPTESESCLGDKGYDVFYEYDNATVTAFKKTKNGTEYIYEIDVSAGGISEGIKIGDKISDIEKKLGNKFQKNGDEYVLQKNGVRLTVYGNKTADEIIIDSTTVGK